MQPPTVLQVTEDSRKRLLSGGGVPPAGSPVGIPVVPGVPGTPLGGPASQPATAAAQPAQSAAATAAVAANLPQHPNPSFNR